MQEKRPSTAEVDDHMLSSTTVSSMPPGVEHLERCQCQCSVLPLGMCDVDVLAASRCT